MTLRTIKQKTLRCGKRQMPKLCLFLSAILTSVGKVGRTNLTEEVNMVEYFKVRPQEGRYQVYYQDNPKSRKLPIVTFDSYLLAKIRAYNGNRIMANSESEFAELVGVK